VGESAFKINLSGKKCKFQSEKDKTGLITSFKYI